MSDTTGNEPGGTERPAGGEGVGDAASSPPARPRRPASLPTSAAVQSPPRIPPPPSGVPTGAAAAPTIDRTPRPLRPPTEIAPQWVAAAIVAGVAADFALRRPPWNNLAGTLLVLALLGGLALSNTITTRSSRALLGLAAVFAVLLSVRTDPRLVAANCAVIVALTIVATVRSGRLFDYRPFQVLSDGVDVFVHAVSVGFEGPIELQARSARAAERRGDRPSVLGPVLRGAAIAIPLVLVLGLLLRSADAVFASFFSAGSLDVGGAIAHVALFVIGVTIMAVLLRMSAAEESDEVDFNAPGLGRVETLVVLVSMNLLFGLFAIAQLVAKTESGDAVLEAAGLTYKQYARQGFFQLLWVAGITLLVLLTLRVMATGWRRDSHAFRALSLMSVSLIFVIVGVAFWRLQLYIGDDGLTPLRFYSSAFSLWVGLAFVLVAIRLLDIKADKAWMTSALFGSGVLALLALNVINPEAVIARNNLAQNESSILWHIEKLSGDGEAVIAEGIDRLDPDVRLAVTDLLCERSPRRPVVRDDGTSPSDGGILSWNLGQRSAEANLAELCS